MPELFTNAMPEATGTGKSASADTHHTTHDLDRDYPSRPQTVYLYGTCLIDLLQPQAGLDALKLLEREGINVVFAEQQTCCGQPAYTSGYDDEARAVASLQMEAMPGDWPVVILSGSCGGMMHHHYPKMFAGQPEEQQAIKFAERVFEFTEFLVHVLGYQPDDQGEQETVAVHTSCTARREMNVHKTGWALIDQLKNVSRVVHDHEFECCGFGGSFCVRYPDISGAMVNDKVDAISATQVDRLISADYGCLMNINGAMEYRNLPLKGEHIASYLWQRTTVNSAGESSNG
ncbi:(Fe-S)-binding protein [Parendozoicomonas haliclonae]|uniref:Lactate utilization protein A n=1 Tax=Parendozoicomonas haliclonae TaxID=1960125 RepID=A0A1X7AFC0_9GAMM|nr:(Fe-S)-binding protein [Parendozoicomonas haliclonae]SMA35233.1 Lactate utilization protein A [Parendozoicomonas haliclonae]